jgi:hypothetical protein
VGDGSTDGTDERRNLNGRLDHPVSRVNFVKNSSISR